MRLNPTSLVLILGLLGSLAGAEGDGGPELDTRQCRDVGCRCEGAHQGQYCGYCPHVRGNWQADWVYECNPRGGCCAYGPRDSCARRRGPCG